MQLKAETALYQPFLCRIESITPLTKSEQLFRFIRQDGKPFDHRPGQFFQVSVMGIGEAPISVSSSPSRGNYLEMGIRKVGKLTGALHQLQTGDSVGMRGPFGSSFPLEDLLQKDLVLIAGGCGLAPLRAMIQYIEDLRHQFGNITILYGAKSPDDLMYRAELGKWENSDLNAKITVDFVPDGVTWNGHVGLIPNLIPPLAIDIKNTVAIICGPPIMYKFVIEKLRGKGMADHQIIVSLERYMKCGVGKCGHCFIEHLYCCLDGPVFRLDKIANIRGAL